VVADVLCTNPLISKRSAAGRAPLAGVATGGMTGVPLGVRFLPCCVRRSWLSNQNRRYQSESKKQRQGPHKPRNAHDAIPLRYREPIIIAFTSLIPPESLEPIRRQGRITSGVLDIAMPQVGLQGVDAVLAAETRRR
jgi:hypothetical protein